MDNDKKISVIMGIYNSKIDLLKKSIESILNQTYTNIEFIICDDCSTNEAYNICEKYGEKDNRIILIKNNKNCGLAFSLNRCLKIATGVYVARQDDDDISEPDRILKQVEFLNLNPEYSLVGSAMWLMDSGVVWGKSIMKEMPQKEDLLFGTPFAHPTIMVRKVAYDCVNGYRVIKKTRRAEDYDLYFRLYQKNLIGYNLPDLLYKYTQSLETQSKRKFKHRLDEVSVRYEGFKNLKLFPKGYLYLLKPICSGLLPNRLKHKRMKKIYSIDRLEN